VSTETYEVVKFNKRTGEDETQMRAKKMNAALSARQKEEVEFRCCPADPFHKVAVAPSPRL
jgi:hypothetical protein